MNMEYKVLWIDDNPSQEFIDIASEMYGLDIINKLSYNSGIEWLKENKDICFAVILDVNCKVDDNSSITSMDVFTDYHRDVLALCEKPLIPWFVYTAGDFKGIESLISIIPSRKRNWDLGRKYYNKPADRKELLSRVQKAVEHREFYDVLKKYEDVLSNYNDDILKRLTRILIAIETNEIANPSIMNEIRKVLEYIIPHLKERGLIPHDITTLSTLRYFLWKLSEVDPMLVPKFISFGFSACIETCQNGSHASNISNDNELQNLLVDKMLNNNKSPYLIRSTVFTMLNFLDWASQLPKNHEETDVLRNKVNSFNIEYKKNKKDN